MKSDQTELDNEKYLIEKAKLDPVCFGILYDKYFEQIFAFAIRRTADVHIAQDITAETFFKALKNLRGYTWKGIPFSAWLYRIAVNEVNMWHRKNNNAPISLDGMTDKGTEPISANDPEEEIMSAQQKINEHAQFKKVVAAIDSLHPKYRDVLALRFFAEKQISDIAQILGKPEGTVKSLLRRGLDKLKKSMSES